MQNEDSARVYSVIEYLANQEQTAGRVVKIHGPLCGQSEAQCCVGSWSQGVVFDAGDLSEHHRIRLIELGTDGSHPPQFGTVTFNSANRRATDIQFDDRSGPQ